MLGARNWDQVDVVLSGINLGPNLGNAIWHSGTLAAAKQAALLGWRGIALSTPVVGEDPDVSYLEPHVERVLELLLPDKSLRLVNVNFPPEPTEIRWTRQAVEQYDGKVIRDTDPRGRPIYWFTVFPLEEHAEGTDLWGDPARLRHDHAARTGPHGPPQAGGLNRTRPPTPPAIGSLPTVRSHTRGRRRPGYPWAMESMRPARVAIVGVGNVGSSFAYALLLSGLAAEIVLIDANERRAEGEAMDLQHAIPSAKPTRVWAGSYADCGGAAVTVIAAGAGQKPGETRLAWSARTPRSSARSCRASRRPTRPASSWSRRTPSTC